MDRRFRSAVAIRLVSAPIGRVVVVLAVLAAPVLTGAAGDPDPSFGIGGSITSDHGYREEARAVAIQPDDHIVLAGWQSTVSSGSNFVLARYRSDGSLDSSFGDRGWVVTEFAGGSVASALVVQADGKLVAAGWAGSTFERDFALARYDTDGTLDGSFGTMGKLVTDFGGAMDFAHALVQQPDGKLVAAGRRQDAAADDFILARYQVDGSLDASFGSGGRVRTDFGALDIAHALAMQPDGKLVAAGSTTLRDGDFAIARYNPDGTLDTGFGDGGVVLTDLGAYDIALAILVQPDGKLVAAGEGGKEGDPTFVLARYQTDGSLDPTFGTGGKVVIDFPDDPSRLVERQPKAVLQADGKVVVAGHRGDPGGAADDFALVRYRVDGSLDPSFGGDGLVTTNFAGRPDRAFALALQPNGRLVAAGSTGDGADFAVARYLADPCGNGVRDPGEECDDGNLTGGDCCSPSCRFEADGSACDDGAPCTIATTCNNGTCGRGTVSSCPTCQSCDGHGGCVSGPRPACRTTTIDDGARLVIGDSARDGGDHLTWSVHRGAATSPVDFGDPRRTTNYALCLFDESAAVPALTFAVAIPNGGSCTDPRCWTALGTKGFRYRSRGGLPDGVQRILLRAGPAGKSKITVKSGGLRLGPPTLPVVPPVRIQLHADNGGCWEAVYADADVERNDARRFVAESDGR